MSAAKFLASQSKVTDVSFDERPQGLSAQFSSLCDGNCGDGVCGQCDCD
jgi:hypothetical protein